MATRSGQPKRAGRPLVALGFVATLVALATVGALVAATPDFTGLEDGDRVVGGVLSHSCDATVPASWLVRKVEFRVDDRVISTDSASPFSCRVPAPAALGAGTHELEARAIYPGGLSSSTTVRVRSDGSASPPPVGEIRFRAEYTDGDLRHQFDAVQEVANDRIQVVDAPGGRGGRAERFEVRPGDEIGDTSPRAEVVKLTKDTEGDERWYRWSTFFDEGFPTNHPEAFVTWTQWRASDESDSYSNFMLWGDELQLRLNGIHWREPVQRGDWHDIVYHVKWSADPDAGFIELWFDGRHVLPRKAMRTLKEGTSNYLKQGLYQSRNMPASRIYHTGLTVSDR